MPFTFDEFPHTKNYDSDLREMIALARHLEKEMKRFISEYAGAYDELKELLAELDKGNFPDSIVTALNNWFEKYGIDIIGKLVNNVFFGLTDDGYFCAYIPDSWSNVRFNTTGLDIEVELQPDYGHLVLSY